MMYYAKCDAGRIAHTPQSDTAIRLQLCTLHNIPAHECSYFTGVGNFITYNNDCHETPHMITVFGSEIEYTYKCIMEADHTW